MTNTIRIKINFGISIILKYYYIFEYLLQNKIVDNIIVSINKNILYDFRSCDDEYYNNYIIFLNYINEFDDLIIENNSNNNYEYICVTTLSSRYNIPIKFKIYKKLLNEHLYCKFNYNFITCTTKILGISIDIFNIFKKDFLNILNEKKIKIILLGEKKITKCKEYTIHETYSIYDDLIQNLINYEDLTISDNNNNNELNSLLKTFNIFSKSKLNIFIGNGGVSELIPYSSNNILGFTYKDNVLDRKNYLHEKNDNINIFDNYQDFIVNLKNLIL